MTTNTTIESATAATEVVINNHTNAVTKARQAATVSQAAAARAANLDQRLKAGDASVDIESMIESKASAERLALLAIAYNDALPGYENVIREARTNETVIRLAAGTIRTREGMAAYAKTVAETLADALETRVPELEDERRAVAAISDGLPHTTATGSGHDYRNGSVYSPIRMGSGLNPSTFEIDGTTYNTSVDVDSALKQIVSELGTIMTERKSARDLPALMAGRAEQTAKDRARMEFDQAIREAEFRPTGGDVRYTNSGRAVIV